MTGDDRLLIEEMMTGKTQETAALAAIESGKGLLLWAADATLAAAVQDVLSSAYSVELSPRLPYPQGPDGPAILLLCPAPAEVLCQALEAGRGVAEALAECQAATAAVLGVQRRSRRQARIAEVGLLRRDPGAFLAFCGLPPGSAAAARMQEAAGPAPGGVLMALVQNRLLADPGLRRLAGEFAAAAMAGPADGSDAEAALQAYLNRVEESQELELLRNQQRSLYEQLETLYGEKRQLEQRLDQMRSGLDSVAVLEARTEALAARLAAKESALQAAGQALVDLEQEREAQKALVHRFETSRSYRMTAPFRRLRGVLREGSR
ncbi:hypothetical protein [Leisingera sp. F5]|uniref:hypothetical protein n=1 Tax=Leisingera sp. F5 TaxID=1813816 RepID=UPI000B2CFF0C|nr:hypothetical protein [Leisingera sp. F5]